MNALRESVIRHPRKRRRPVWAILLMVSLGTVALFGIGYAFSVVLRDQGIPVAKETGPATISASPLPCATTMVTPAEVLPRTSRVTINVFNATKRQGLASNAADALATRGFDVKKVGNDPEGQTIVGVAEIRYGPKGAEGAKLLGFYLPGAEMLPDDRSKKAIDIVLGREFTEIVGEAQVGASLASPSPSTSGPGCAVAVLVAPIESPGTEESGAPKPSLTPSASTSAAEG